MMDFHLQRHCTECNNPNARVIVSNQVLCIHYPPKKLLIVVGPFSLLCTRFFQVCFVPDFQLQ